jgi:hypothetical protein
MHSYVKVNNIKVVGGNKTKGPKLDSKNRLTLPMPEGYWYE